jgi:hypothetical protein
MQDWLQISISKCARSLVLVNIGASYLPQIVSHRRVFSICFGYSVISCSEYEMQPSFAPLYWETVAVFILRIWTV